MEIFGVFEGLAMCCILAVYKCIEERLKKDGVLTVEKRRLFIGGLLLCHFESVVYAEITPKFGEIYAGSLVLHFHFIVKDARGYDYRSC